MILGNVCNLGSLDYLGPKMTEILEYLRDTDFTKLDEGKIELDGKNLFVNIIDTTTEPAEARKAEAHKNYIDIQFVASGKESIGVAIDTKNNTPSVPYSAEKDIVFYKDVENEILLDLHPGDFGIFFPEDIHRPKCHNNGVESSVRKVIVKIKTTLLNK